MASAVVGALRVILSADTAEFDSAMKRVAGSATAWSKDLGNIGRQATAVGSTLTKALTLPILGLGAASIKAASDFESSFAGVRKTVDATEQEFAELAQGLRDMSIATGANVNDLNRVAEAAGQLGIKKDDILAFTRTMQDLGVSTNLSADEAATATAQFQNIFGAAGKDVDRFGATLVALGNAGASTEKDILEMGLRIAGAGRQVGLTQAQVMAFASSLSSVGINAEAGGSALSRVFLKINDAVMKGGGGLAEFARVSGMSAGEFKKAWGQDAAAATTAFIGGLARLKDQGENVNSTLEGLVGKNIIIKDTLLRASGSVADLTSNLKLAADEWKRNKALTEESEKRYATFENQLKRLWAQVRDVAITLGTSLLPVMKDLLVVAQPIVAAMGKMAEAFAKLPEPVRLGVVGFLGMAAAVGPLLWGFGQLASGAGTLIGAFKSKGIIMRVINADYVALAGSVKGLAAVYWPLAAAIAAVWAAWKIGNTETVKNSVAEWGLASENLTARLYRAVTGIEKMTPAQARAAVAATAAAEAAQKFATGVDKTTKAAVDFVGPMEKSSEATTNFDLRQQAATESTKELAAAAKKAHEERLEQLKAASALEAKIKEENKQFAEQAIGEVDKKKAAERDYYNWLGERRMEDDANRQPDALVSTMLLPWETFKKAVQRDSPGVAANFANIADAFKNIGTTILQAVQGGGSVLGSIGSSLGMSLGADLAKNMGGFLTKHLGKFLGDAVGAVLPGLGALIGPGLQLLGKGFKKLFGIGKNDEVKKYNASIEEVRQTLLKTHGNLETLEARANSVGLSFKENWGHQGKAGLEAFNALVVEFEQRWKDSEAAVEALNTELDDTKGQLDDVIGKAADLGYEFDQAGNFTGVSFDKVKAKAEEFGVSVDGLGPKFRQQGIDADAKSIIDAFELMAKAGGDVGGILVGMKDEIGTLVAKSIALGTTIPANMKPWIDELARTHQLVDENGNEITDLSKIKFGDPVKTEFEKISSAILELITHIQELIDKIAAIPTQKTLTVTTQTNTAGAPPGSDNTGGGGDTGDPGHAVGTYGRYGDWFKNFGAGMATSLHGLEAVVTAPQAVPFAMDVMSRLGSGAQGSAATAPTPRVQASFSIQNDIIIDGQRMKDWVKQTHLTALDNNEAGYRTDTRELVGVK